MDPLEESPPFALSSILNMDDFPRSGFKNTRFTDLVIFCQGKKFHVHKLVLAKHSGFFNKACDPDSPWIEARTGEIHLDNDQPEIVQAMLEYCYRGKGFLEDTGRKGRKPEEVLRFYVLLRALADQYQVVGLENATFDRFEVVLYCMLYEDEEPEISPACMGKIAREIFESTLETESNFRNTILSKISLHITTLRRSRRFKKEIGQIDGFWEALADFDAEAGYQGRYCPSCGRQQYFDARSNYRKLIRCEACRTSHDLNAWNKSNQDMELDMAPDTDMEEESTSERPSTKRQRVE